MSFLGNHSFLCIRTKKYSLSLSTCHPCTQHFSVLPRQPTCLPCQPHSCSSLCWESPSSSFLVLFGFILGNWRDTVLSFPNYLTTRAHPVRPAKNDTSPVTPAWVPRWDKWGLLWGPHGFVQMRPLWLWWDYLGLVHCLPICLSLLPHHEPLGLCMDYICNKLEFFCSSEIW